MGALKLRPASPQRSEFDGELWLGAPMRALAASASSGRMSKDRGSIRKQRAPRRLMNVALNCPSGAIRVSRHDGGADETNPKVNTIAVRENGPLALFDAEIVPAGSPIGTRATLCRCGWSKNKPYCDGSHVAAALRTSTGEPATTESVSPARQAQWRVDHHPLSERTARRRRPGRDHFRNRAHRESPREDRALPLRPFGQQTLLRRRARKVGFVAP